MMKRSLGWIALVAIATLPFAAACRSTKSSSGNVQNMTTGSEKECCEKAAGACCKDEAAKKATQNALLAPEGACTGKSECSAEAKKAECSKKSSVCPATGGNTNEPQ